MPQSNLIHLGTRSLEVAYRQLYVDNNYNMPEEPYKASERQDEKILMLHSREALELTVGPNRGGYDDGRIFINK